MKVKQIADALNVDSSVIVKKLKQLGHNVENGNSEIDEVIGNKMIAKNKQASSGMHIIRRQVKVVTTDSKGNQVENITTNKGGTIEKTSIVHNNNQRKSSYSKEGLGVVRSNRNRVNMQNVIVTQNGKRVEPKKEEVAAKEEVKPVQQPKPDVAEQKNTVKVESSYEKVRPNYEKKDNNARPYSKERNEQRSNFQNRDNRDRKPGFNKERPDFRKSQGQNNSNNGSFQRPFNRNNGQRPNYQNRDNTGYKVNRFIKESQINDTIQKETRDYSTTLIDKKKYNEEKPIQDTKREKKNANVMREENTRMDFGKLRGMQVSEDRLMDLYDRGENRKYASKKKKVKQELNTTKVIPLTDVTIPESMTVKELAEAIKKQASEVIKKLFTLGIMATVNQEIDFDTAFLICGEFGINATKQVIVTEEDVLFDDTEDDEKDLEVRPPIVTIMGHVDHGKTSLLDKIRQSKVALGESGGITQHIGAYKVEKNGREITFLDTPGHEAFSEMRARGAQITDIVIIVVAADDSIKPQTVEAINHSKAAGVSIIVAINKIDKPNANIEKVKQDLLEHELVPEEWGGDTICVPVSAKTGEGIDNLLEMILLVADVKDLKANPHKQAKGTVIEAKLDKTKGALTTMLVQRGTLNVGDTIVLGDIVGKIRSMKNDKGQSVKSAGPSTPVEILGLGHVPMTGEVFYEVKDEKTAHKLIEKRKAKQRLDLIKKSGTVTLNDLFDQIKDGELKNLDIVLRADVQGSVQAIKSSLERLSNDEVRVRVIASNTGGITESDITLAKLSNAIVIGFNVKLDSNVAEMADKEKVDLRQYSVIYDAIDDVEQAMKGLLKPIYKEEIRGQAEVRHLFKISSVGTIAGSYVISGKIVRNASMRVIRNGSVIAEVKIDSLKREKDDVKEAAEGYECGIKLEKFNDLKEGDILECFEMVEQERK